MIGWLLACGLAEFPAPVSETMATADTAVADPSDLVIEYRQSDDWEPLDGAVVRSDTVEVQLSATSVGFDAITEVVWLLGDEVTRDREGPPWSPHGSDAGLLVGPGPQELCAQVWVDASLAERCAGFEVAP